MFEKVKVVDLAKARWCVGERQRQLWALGKLEGMFETTVGTIESMMRCAEAGELSQGYLERLENLRLLVHNMVGHSRWAAEVLDEEK